MEIDCSFPNDPEMRALNEKFERCEISFKMSLAAKLHDAGITCLKEESIWTEKNFINHCSLIADFASHPHKKWVIEVKHKSDISTLQRAIGQCLMYRQIAGYENAIICIPGSETFKHGCFQSFVKLCESLSITVVTEVDIVETIKKYEPTTNSCPDSKL